ncbi:MAG TPA: hypothetical protein VMU41_09340 [Candidatus Binataceae bacterium]|nr:hypothetical protein [Candidatus Binataceae bacterium]
MVERKLKLSGLTFYFTWDHVGFKELPSYGQEVVVVLVGDEWCRIPPYFDKVAAIFKWYGVRPIVGGEFTLSYLSLLTLAQYGRMFLKRLPGLLRYWQWRISSLPHGGSSSAPIFPIPLGYDKGQLDLPIVPIDRREYDVFFAGSVNHHSHFGRHSFRNMVGNPKALSRSKMIAQLRSFERDYPGFKVKLSITRDFHASETAGSDTYSREMMQAKICVVPRGTSFETFRFFEALRYGCVIVTEALPQRWFYDGSPAIRVSNWGKLEETLTELLNNKDLMRQKHRESLEWWKNKCSEVAVGSYIVETLAKLGCRDSAREPVLTPQTITESSTPAENAETEFS